MDTSNQKPDLTVPVRGSSEGGKRILASLEYGGRLPGKLARVTRWPLDGWTVGMSLAVLLMAVLAWMSRESATRTEARAALGDTVARSENGPAAAPVPGVASIRQPAAAATLSDSSTPAAPDHAPSAATIVSLPESPRPTSTTQASTATRSHQAVAAASATTSTSATTTAAAPARATAGAAPIAVASSGRSTGVTASAATRNAGTSASATRPATAPDTDVALLTALVAHSGTPTNVTPERSRDVVLRQEGEGTTLLLARCKQLGLIEGMLCRSRICSGQWESDPACRAPSH